MLDKIYEREIFDGLTDKLAVASIAYCQEIRLSDNDILKINNINNELAQKTTGSEQPDLFSFESILASTCWNKNFDIFDCIEMWRARSSPEDKPLNLEHKQDQIIGHITGNRVVSEDFQLIPDDTNESQLPGKFHIITSNVIYKYWEDKTKAEQIKQIIAEIQDGQWFVSMECLFTGFDYGVISPEGEHKIIARNDSSSFLTKHLRQYGGTGLYDGYTIGRVMRNIRFSGKGIVRKPANPESVIFTPNQNFAGVLASVVYLTGNEDLVKSSTEIIQMNLEDQIKELKASVATLTQERDTLKSELANSSIKTIQVKLDEAIASIDALEKRASTAEQAKETAEASLKAANDKANDYKKEAEKLYKDKSKAERRAQLVTAKVPTVEIDHMLTAFENLDDDHFSAMTVLLEAQFGDIDTHTVNLDPTIPVVHKASPVQYVKEMISKYPKSNGVQQNITQATENLATVQVTETVNHAAAAATAVDETEAARAEVNEYMSTFLKNAKKSEK
jgi:hypothetical protein